MEQGQDLSFEVLIMFQERCLTSTQPREFDAAQLLVRHVQQPDAHFNVVAGLRVEVILAVPREFELVLALADQWLALFGAKVSDEGLLDHVRVVAREELCVVSE